MQINQYNFVHLDKPNCGGGVAFYAKSGLDFEIVKQTSVINSLIEQLSVVISLQHVKIAIVVIYSVEKQFTTFLHLLGCNMDLLITHYNNIVLRDFNLDVFHGNGYKNFQLLDAMESYSLSQLITEPTRVTSSSVTLIDLIFSISTYVSDAKVVINNLDVDHFAMDCFFIYKQIFL